MRYWDLFLTRNDLDLGVDYDDLLCEYHLWLTQEWGFHTTLTEQELELKLEALKQELSNG